MPADADEGIDPYIHIIAQVLFTTRLHMHNELSTIPPCQASSIDRVNISYLQVMYVQVLVALPTTLDVPEDQLYYHK